MKYYYRFHYTLDITKPTAKECEEQIQNVIYFNHWQPVIGEINTYGLPQKNSVEALASASCIEAIYFETDKVLTEFTWYEGDMAENAIEDWLSLRNLD